MSASVQGLAYARRAFETVFGVPASDGEARVLDAIAALESNRGAGWRGPGAGSNNMGAIQCGRGWTGDRFAYVDTKPNADGSSTPYRAEFRAYATPLAGWIDLCKVAYVNRDRGIVREAADAEEWLLVSEALHSTGYYEGFGRTVSERIAHHHRALTRALFRARGEQCPEYPIFAAFPTLRQGCHRGADSQIVEAVRMLQGELEIARDGAFGPVTDAVVRRYQRAHGLAVDGAVGDITWAVLLGDDYQPGEDPKP